MTNCASYRSQCTLLVVGAAAIIITGISIPVINLFVRQQIKQHVVLKNGSDAYKQWLEPTIPIYVQFYVFDLKNPMETLAGAKPYLEQRGPYSYREHRKKVDIIHNTNDTLTYKQIKSYHFVPEMSVGPDSDTFVTINIPLMALFEALQWESDEMRKIIISLLKLIQTLERHAEDVFITRTVRDIAFGYHDPLLSMGHRIMPHWFYTDFVGVFAGKNDTDDGTYTVHSGEDDISLVGQIDKYNGSSYMPFWSTPYANMVNGTDGSLARPFLDKEKTLYLFSTDICRSVYGTFHGMTSSPQGIALYRFSAARAAMESVKENPDNAGFCTPRGNCMGSGVLNVTSCHQLDFFPVPVIVSFPHFYMADDKYLAAVIGLRPDAEQHSTDIDVEPHTGLVMHVSKRLQINVYVRQNQHMSEMKNVQTMVFPVLWINESAAISDDLAGQVHAELLRPLRIAMISQYVGFIVGGILVLVASLLLLRHRMRDTQILAVAVNGSETDSLLINPTMHSALDGHSQTAER